MEQICVVGLGYIGLPSASLMAVKGFRVHDVDVNPHAVELIARGETHIYEPDLDVLVKSAVNSGKFTVSTTPVESDVFILAVPTPFKGDHVPDISCVESAVASIAPVIRPGNIVVLESTSPIGTTEKIADWISGMRPDLNVPGQNAFDRTDLEPIYIAHCPERVLPGQILKELIENDRIIGGIDKLSAEKARAFYARFVTGEILTTDTKTAELCKLAENSYRDVNIALANELSIICDKIGIRVWDLIRLANRHPRVNILEPGPGVGGHCIAVDPWFIVDAALEQAQLIRTAREVNDGKPEYVIEQIRQAATKFENATIATLGLTYKPDIDDLRESPALEIVRRIANEQFGNILVVEPNIEEVPNQLQNNVEFATLDSALDRANIVVLLVHHLQFKSIMPRDLEGKVVIDTRGLWH